MSLLTPPGTNASSIKPQFWPLLAPDSSWTVCRRRGALGRNVPPHLMPACLVPCRPSCCQENAKFGGDTSHHWTSRAASLHPSCALVPTRPGKMSCSEWKQGLTNPRLSAYCGTGHLPYSVWIQQLNVALFCTFCYTRQKWSGPFKTLRQCCVFMSAICWHLLPSLTFPKPLSGLWSSPNPEHMGTIGSSSVPSRGKILCLLQYPKLSGLISCWK